VDLSLGYGTDSYSSELTRQLNEDNDFDERQEASITLVQPLYRGGEIKSQVAVEKANLDSADKRVFDNAESLALDAIIAHMEVWRQRNLLELTDRNVETHRQILEDIEERQRAGAGSSADVMQTKGRLSLTMASRAFITAELEAARANYARVVGSDPGKLSLPKEYKRSLPKSLEEAQTQAERNNPKLAALAADIRAADNEVAVKKASFLPRINLELGSTYEDGVEAQKTYTQNNVAMLRLRWNLYKGGSDTASRDASAARKRQLMATRNDQYLRIVEETRDTWYQYRTAEAQTQTYRDAVQYNRQTREAYREQFIVGQRSLLDVLDSENELFQTSGHLITARTNEIVAAYRLLALGGNLMKNLLEDPKVYLEGEGAVDNQGN
jgi:adhesin transport system outer membrane protein